MNTEPVCELNDVTVPSRRAPDRATIEGVTWTVQQRDFWVVGGLQGTGKSDLIFMLTGLTKPIRGTYTLLGQNMATPFSEEFRSNRVRVGMVFDDSRLLNHLTFADNIALPVRYHENLHAEEADGWVEALLKAVNIVEYAHNTPSSVAWHWRRRAALARALAIRPEILFLENPLRGMDWRHSAWWIDFIQRLWRGHDLMQGRPLTIVASTDEFRPWRDSGAQFALLHEKRMEIVGESMPADEGHEMFGRIAEKG
jgi:ABC-type transporter Mla maintaining outer membrane lipid asymmetry ATPase subunit MlaF